MTALANISENTKTAAAVNAGRHRAASHNSIGSSISTGASRFHQGSGNAKIMIAVAAAAAMTAAAPSMNSWGSDGRRMTLTRPTINGATVIMPIPSDTAQCCQVIKAGTSELWNSLYAIAPASPEQAVATIAATISNSTWRTLVR